MADNSSTSVMKAMAVLDCFRSGEMELGVTEIAKRTGIPKSSVHRACASLCEASYLVHTEHRGYRLALKVFELGGTALLAMGLRRDASRYLQRLTVLTGETSHLAVLDEVDVVYIDKIETPRSKPIPSRVGHRNPAHATAVGKALLSGNPSAAAAVTGHMLHGYTPNTITDGEHLRAELSGVKREGIAYDRQERVVGTTCIAAPVRNHRGHVVAAISVAGASERMPPQRLIELSPVIRRASVLLSADLGWRGSGIATQVAS